MNQVLVVAILSNRECPAGVLPADHVTWAWRFQQAVYDEQNRQQLAVLIKTPLWQATAGTVGSK